jgi:superfamily II DNA or RNA helicase
VADLKRAATFANPKFFELQRMRFSTWNTPRYICTAEQSEDGRFMYLPRGLLSRCTEIGCSAGADIESIDLRPGYRCTPVKFTGVLHPHQKKALRDLARHDMGVLVAPPGSGKTVIACALVAKRKLPTLILVHRKQLADQWKQRLLQFTDLARKQIGVYDSKGARRKGVVDVGMLQTLAREKEPDKILSDYGHVIVDECHHVPAVSFEPVLKRIVARYYVGLTATPYRNDGLEKIIHMQCGPVIHSMAEGEWQLILGRTAIIRETAFRIEEEDVPQPAIHEIWQQLVDDEKRTELIVRDILATTQEGEFPLVLSDRKGHLERLLAVSQDASTDKAPRGFILTSELGKRRRSQAIAEALRLHEGGKPVFLLSTGSLIGEGFDLPELSCLMLAMPLSFKGRLVQYAGRLHRQREGKTGVVIYDYVDANLGLGITMFRKRLTTYRKMGYCVQMSDALAAKVKR